MYHIPQPLADKLIVLPLEKKEETVGELIIPETANKEIVQGKVVAVSETFEKFIQVDDVVLYPFGAGTGQLFKGKTHLWLSVNELWGKVKKQ